MTPETRWALYAVASSTAGLLLLAAAVITQRRAKEDS